MARPLVLCSNDDGIDSPHLIALADLIEEFADVIVVAPERQRSAASHAITLHKPLRLTERGKNRFSLSGTPVDCVRLAKLGRYSRAFIVLSSAVRARSSQLAVAFTLAFFFLIVGSTAMYWIEGDAQPNQFGSIPRAMWWCVATMTTVGYGDAVPATAVGKLLGGLIATGGIVLIAIPTGIMAAAFSDEMHHGPPPGPP